MTEPVLCRLDIVPALLSISSDSAASSPEATYPKTRVIVTADRLYAWTDGPNFTPVNILDAKIEEIVGRNTTGWAVQLADGRVVDFKRTEACNCGSRLKGFRPFPQGLIQGAWPHT